MRIYLFLDVVFIYEDTKMPYTHSHTGHPKHIESSQSGKQMGKANGAKLKLSPTPSAPSRIFITTSIAARYIAQNVDTIAN